MLLSKTCLEMGGGQVTIALPDSTLTTIWFECLDRDTYRYAGIALLALWSVDQVPAATKTLLRQQAVDRVTDDCLGIHEDGCSDFVGQVATLMWHRDVDFW